MADQVEQSTQRDDSPPTPTPKPKRARPSKKGGAVWPPSFHSLQQDRGVVLFPMHDTHFVNVHRHPHLNLSCFWYPLSAGDETRSGRPLATNTGLNCEVFQLRLLRMFWTTIGLFKPKMHQSMQGVMIVAHKPGEAGKTNDTALGILFVVSCSSTSGTEADGEGSEQEEEVEEAHEAIADGAEMEGPDQAPKIFANFSRREGAQASRERRV